MNEPEEKTVKDFSDLFTEDPVPTPVQKTIPDNTGFTNTEDYLISHAPDWRNNTRRYLEEQREGLEDRDRIQKAEQHLRMLLRFCERQARKIAELERTVDAERISINCMSRDLDHAMYKCHLYQDIAKDKAKRARKLPKDHTGYTCVASREVMEKYDKKTDTGRIVQDTVVGYRTTFAMPYPSALGYDELRRLLEIDLVHGGKEGLYSIPGMGYVMGIDRIIEGLPNNGKHPGPEDLCDIQTPACILYRVSLNTGKRYAEADLYTTTPLIIPPECYA
jgi:hypothetical protein